MDDNLVSLSKLQSDIQSMKFLSVFPSWEKKAVTVGKDIPVNGTQESYEEYPYIVAVVEMLSAWKNKNYGKLSSYPQKCSLVIFRMEKGQENVESFLKTRYLRHLNSSKLKNAHVPCQKCLSTYLG